MNLNMSTSSDMRLDNHKLMYHPDRVSTWMDGDITYPIYIEISVTSACNHRCLFCAPNFFLNYKPEYMDTEVLKKAIADMATLGIKSIMYGGEGEPLLHKDIVEIIEYTKKCGIDVGLTTNGVLFTEIMAKRLLPHLSWVKFSVDAGTSNIYAKLHGTKKEDFNRVLTNISRASFLNRLKKYNSTIGVQAILFEENIKTMSELARFLKSAHPDYFVVKPYSEHSSQLCKDLHAPSSGQIMIFKAKMSKYINDYPFIYRDAAFENAYEDKPYDKCYAQDFMAYIDTLGGVHSCINYIGDKDYCYGNIYDSDFEDIWKDKIEINPDLKKCRTICRMDKINRYLYELNNPSKHVNFI